MLRQSSGPNDDVQAERLRAPGQFLGDTAEAEQPERHAVETPGLCEFLLVPMAGAQLCDVVGDATIQREDETEGELRHRDRVLARAIGHVDAACRRGLNVDRVVASTRPDDQRQVAGIHHRGSHLGGPHDQDLRLRLAERGDECLVLQRRVVDDVAAGRPQAVKAGSFELVGDENLHASFAPRSSGSTGRPGVSARTRWTWEA